MATLNHKDLMNENGGVILLFIREYKPSKVTESQMRQ